MPAITLAATRPKVSQVVDLMRILLAAGDTVDMAPVGNRVLFAQATASYQDANEINRAAENHGSGEDLVKYVNKALNLLQVPPAASSSRSAWPNRPR